MFFAKSAFRSWDRFLMRFWCQLGSILPPKIHQKRSKNRPQEAPKFWSIFASLFYRFWLRFGTQVGPMLATLSAKMGGGCGMLPSSLLGLCYFSIFWPSWPHLGPILAPFWRLWTQLGLDFESFWLHFCTMLALYWVRWAQEAGTGWAGGVTRSAKN